MANCTIYSYDLATVLTNTAVHSGVCAKQYTVVINSFAKFLDVFGKRDLNALDLTDSNIALFLHHTGSLKGFKPHIKSQPKRL